MSSGRQMDYENTHGAIEHCSKEDVRLLVLSRHLLLTSRGSLLLYVQNLTQNTHLLSYNKQTVKILVPTVWSSLCLSLCLSLAMAMAITQTTRLLLAAAALRLLFIAFGEWQDAHMEVRYTDIDYQVFSDAAALLAKGRSPFERETYRYSPLLALFLVPNVLLHPAWGKLFFSAAGMAMQFLFPWRFLFLDWSKHFLKWQEFLLFSTEIEIFVFFNTFVVENIRNICKRKIIKNAKKSFVLSNIF